MKSNDTSEGHRRRPSQEPTITTGPNGIEVAAHPAFAQMTISRVDGATTLYGSDFAHMRYIRIRVVPSTLQRSLSNDLPMPGRNKHIEFDMSEAQWAAAVSSLNVGTGTQCTLVSLKGEPIPALPAPKPRTDQFAREVTQNLARARQTLSEAASLVAASGLSKVKQAEILSKLGNATHDLGSNLGFVAEQFEEHMDKTIQEARIEINAYAGTVMHSAQHLTGLQGPGILELPSA